MPGKVRTDDLLEFVFGRTGRPDSTVVQGPAVGEDAAAIDWPGGTLVVSADPISLSASRVGTLGVAVACNDVAASGGDPRWLTAVLLLPGESADDEEDGGENPLAAITRDLDDAAREAGVTIVGGHSEYVDALERPVLSLTAMGPAESFVSTGGAEPGDRIVLTKAAGLEGTAILAADFGADLDVPADTLERAEGFLEEVSVLADARALRDAATAMHDPTEGGVAAGLDELARASNVRLAVDREAIPIREETQRVCDAAGVDPLRIFGSGALLATVPADALEERLEALAEAGVDAAEIGTVEAGPAELVIDGESVAGPIEDDLYPLWERTNGAE